MAEVSIGDAIGAGFQLIRRQPLAVMVWGLLGLATSAASFGVFGSYYATIATSLFAPGGPVNLVTSPLFAEQARRMQGASLLIGLLSAAVDCVIACAVFRSVIHPEERRFAYLRVGAPEMFAFILIIAGYIAFVVALVAFMLIMALVVGMLVAAHATAVAVVVGILGAVAILVGVVYVALRLSLVVPMIVNDGRFHFADAWALTRRHAGALFVVALALLCILLLAEAVVGLLVLAAGVGFLSSAAGGLSHLQSYFHEAPATILAGAAPFLVIVGLLWIPLTGCSFAVMGAPWARAYRDLSGPDLAATFS